MKKTIEERPDRKKFLKKVRLGEFVGWVERQRYPSSRHLLDGRWVSQELNPSCFLPKPSNALFRQPPMQGTSCTQRLPGRGRSRLSATRVSISVAAGRLRISGTD